MDAEDLDIPHEGPAAPRTIGIYSFPRSGNTWVRHILAGAVGQNPRQMLPGIYRHQLFVQPYSLQGRPFHFYKSHSATELTTYKTKSVVNDGIVYILRHPLDVFLSQLNYLSDSMREDSSFAIACSSVEDLAERGDLDIFFSIFLAFGTLAPRFVDAASWFQNVRYWTTRASSEKHIVVLRYEDLHRDPEAALRPVGALLGIESDFLMNGFKAGQERTKKDGRFFWKQKVDNYKDLLPQPLIDRFEKHHGAFVRSLGYSF